MNIDNFLKLVSKRQSCRNYLSKDVPDNLISNCLEAARLSPSACNKQPWRFIIIKNIDTRFKIFNEGLLPGLPMPWFKTAPVIVALCAESKILTHKIAPLVSGIDYRLVDLGIAGEHFVLAAESQGLCTCWIGWFKEKKIKQILNIPRQIKVISLMTLGYSENTEAIPKIKLPIDKIAHFEKWNQHISQNPNDKL